MNNKLELTWFGKDCILNVEPRVLIEDKTKSNDKTGKSENLLIHGDNLLALKALENEFSGKIKCIYIDPPYNTGAIFENYDDNLMHSTWLNFMKPRLEILKKLLREDGLIFIQIDDNEQAYLKILCDEIFGRACFLTMLTIESGEVFGTKAAHINKTFVKVKDYILIYKKNLESNVKVNPLYTKTVEPFDPHYSIFINQESLEKDSLLNFLRNVEWVVEVFNKHNTKLSLDNISYIMKIDKKFNDFIINDLSSNIFQDQPSKFKDVDNKMVPNKIYKINKLLMFKTSSGSIRYYKSFKDSIHLTSDYIQSYCRSSARGDLWKNYHTDMRNVDDEGNVKFKNSKKPERLIRDILMSCTDVGDIVLDSFLGSGTTAAVAHKMGRKWIGIEYGEHAYTHCKKRLDAVISGNDESGISKFYDWHGGGGYKFYELAPTLIKVDSFGQPIFNTAYNSDMLAAAIALHEGFKYQPEKDCFWKQSKNDNNTYLYVTTNHVSVELLSKIKSEMKDDEFLLVSCKSFDDRAKSFSKNITIKKIPHSLLKNCEFGKDNYNLNIICPPLYEEENEDE